MDLFATTNLRSVRLKAFSFSNFDRFWRKSPLFRSKAKFLARKKSITGLEVGSGGEEETEVACLAVRGLTSLLLSAASVNGDFSFDEKLLGCPVLSKITRNSRATVPRLTGCIPARVSARGIGSKSE